MRRPAMGRLAYAVRAICLFASAPLFLALLAGSASAQTAMTAPPRPQGDVTAILDQQKPDPAAAARTRAAADQPPPAGADPATLARFYYKRGEARSRLGRYTDAIADAQAAFAAGKGHLAPNELSLFRQLEGLQYGSLGDPRKALETFLIRAKEAIQSGNRGPLFNTYRNIGKYLIKIGDLAQAEVYVNKIKALLAEARGWKPFAMYGTSWQGEYFEAIGELAESKGQYADAEAAYRKGEAAKREALIAAERENWLAPRSLFESNIDTMISAQGRVKARQGRLAEAEADIRRALLGRLTAVGKYNSGTAEQVNALAQVLTTEGRLEEAEKLCRTAIDIYRTIGLADDTQAIVHSLMQLASIVNLRGDARQASRIFDEIENDTKGWDERRRQLFDLGAARISSLYRTQHVEEGITAAQTQIARATARFGAGSFDAAYAHGLLGIGLALARRDTEALREFKLAVPVLLSSASQSADDDATAVVLRKRQTTTAVERYMALLARMQGEAGVDVAAETLRLAEAIRGSSVQQALAESGARVLARDPATAGLVRKQQDTEKQVAAELGLLNNLLALPPEQRDDAAVDELRKQVATLQADDAKAKQDIRRRFPKYADLIEPKPPAIEEIQSVLGADEALVSFYFGDQASFAWALPKAGPIVFAALPIDAAALEQKVKQLRQALEPDVASVEQIPPFDLALSHELYDLLLRPVQSGWQGAKRLIVVTNGALGTLPLGLLTTAQSPLGAAEPLFAAYRSAPWLARTHAISVIPSAAALVTLRRLPPGSQARQPLIGFGDPYFNVQEAEAAEHEARPAVLASATDTATRGMPLRTRAAPHPDDVDRTEFALLPRLPDTRAELYAMARALGADPSKALFLGKDANARTVETMDLSRFRVVAFATHGLVPGDLDGLTQPALALTAPEVAGVEGDGLLTMEKILPLKLDADWVVLSACNTAAGAGAGAEAASGLGRAFFYAGTRSLLLTNWSVDSVSARNLISDLFRRQSADPHLPRAEALREAMMALLDGPGFVDETGKTLFTYAHPLFWAPYSIMGDGGGS